MGLLLLRTLHRRGNQTYVVLFKGESSDSFYLRGDHFKALGLKNDPFYLVRNRNDKFSKQGIWDEGSLPRQTGYFTMKLFLWPRRARG